MPKPDTKMGGSGYPDEMMRYDPKTRTYTWNPEQWRRQRGYSGPDAELRGIAAKENASMGADDLADLKDNQISDFQDYVLNVKDKVKEKAQDAAYRKRMQQRSQAIAENKIKRMGIQSTQFPTLSRQIMTANKKRNK